MFKNLAKERRERQVTYDHVQIIKEATEDVIVTDQDGEQVSLDELDAVIENDAETASEQEVEALDDLLESMTQDEKKNVVKMTREEIEEHVKKADNPSIEELDE